MRPVKSLYIVVLVLLLSHSFAIGAGATDDALKIIQYGEARLRGNTTQAVMSMTIQRASFTRKLKIRSWTVGDTHALVEILDPPKEQGVSSLRNNSEMWNYLPKSDQTVRVPTSLMLQSWMGSDFTNDDLMKASSLARDYRHRIVKYVTHGKDRLVEIECLPKPDAPVVWGKILYWARVADKLPIREEYFDDHGKPVRTLYLEDFKKMDDRITPSRITVRKMDGSNESTVIVYYKILYDRAVSSSVFNRDHLRQNSQEGKVLTAGWMLRKIPDSWFR